MRELLRPLSAARLRPKIDVVPWGQVMLWGAIPLEIALWVRRRVVARGWPAWRAAAVVVVTVAGSAVVLWGPVRYRLTEWLVERAVIGHRELILPGDLADFEAWARGVAGPYVDKALLCYGAMVLVLRVIVAVALWRQARAGAAGRRPEDAGPQRPRGLGP